MKCLGKAFIQKLQGTLKKVNWQAPGTGTGDGWKWMGMDWTGKVSPVPGHDSKIPSLNSINKVISPFIFTF